MAINYTFSQVVSIIAEGKDKEALMDIGRRFPLLMNKVSVLSALAGDAFVDFAKAMPEYLTALKVNNAMKGTGADASDADEETESSKAAEEDEAGDEDEAGGDYDSMNGKQLLDLVRERKLTKKLPKPFKKADMVKVLKEADAQSEDDSDGAEEADEASNPYDGKSAVELFKECKKRGLKAVPKKPAKFYVDMLVKDDAAKAAEEDDGWDDGDDAEDTKTAKASKPGKGAKTAKKEEDDDEDWDI